jgi:hypothetical protein
MSDQPQTVEPVPVQLTRIEGTVNLIAYQMGEVKAEVTEVKTSMSALGRRVTAIELAQAQASGSSSFLKSWLPTIIAALGVMAAFGFGIKFGG